MILLDTQVVLWLAQVPELLSDNATEAISEARRRNGVAIADKTLWELAMLISRKRVGVKTSLRDFLQAVRAGYPGDQDQDHTQSKAGFHAFFTFPMEGQSQA